MNEEKIKIKADIRLLNSHINDYYDELNTDLTVTLFNIKERALSVSSIRSKWLMYLFKERENMKRLKTAKEGMITKLLDQMNKDPQHRSMINRKIEDDINSNNESVVKLNIMIDNTKEIIQFLDFSVNILNDYGFTVKNALDCIKLEQM